MEAEMQYLLMLYADQNGWTRLTKEQQEQGAAAYTAYTQALKKAGVLAGANRLQPTTVATTVRMAGNLDFQTYIVSDATAAFELTGHDGRVYDPEIIHQISLVSLHHEFATVVETGQKRS
jgi:hypothetical protein